MAAVALGTSYVTTNAAQQYTTSAFTPAAGDLLVAIVMATSTTAAGAMDDSQGLGWSLLLSGRRGTSHTFYAFVAQSFASDVSTTVTFDCTGDAADGCAIAVLRVSGMPRAGVSAVRQSAKQETQSPDTPAPTLPTSALSTNPLIGAVVNNTNPATMTPPIGWSELTDTGYNSPTTGLEVAAIDSGFGGTTVTWGSASDSNWGALVIELDASAEDEAEDEGGYSTASARLECQLGGVWEDLMPDVVAAEGIRVRYGIRGNGPLHRVADSGELDFVLRNDADNSAHTLGYYSPAHASKRPGWGFGVLIRLVLTRDDAVPLTVDSITSSDGVATVTTAVSHGLSSGDHVTIAGANEPEYNGVQRITVTSAVTFTFAVEGAPDSPATGTITATRCWVKFFGKVRRIVPDPGQYRSRRVRVTAYDYMRDLAEADLRNVAIQVNTTEADLLAALYGALPSDAVPPYVELDAGVDTIPIAFDDLGGGAKAAAVANDIVVSAIGRLFPRGDGTVVYQSRASFGVSTSRCTLSDDDVIGLSVPSSLDQTFRRVLVTDHPKTVSENPDEDLYELPAEGAIEIEPGETLTISTRYTDPNDRQRPVGGVDVVTTLVPGTHYAANQFEDGSGNDMTASLNATLTPYASHAEWTLENTHGTDTLYVTLLKVVGKVIRDPGPRTFEATSSGAGAERALAIDLPYQADAVVSQAAARHFLNAYGALSQQIEWVEFFANHRSALLTQALAREPGEIVTVSETVTGIAEVQAVIHSVELRYERPNLLWCRWGLAPAAVGDPYWQLGIAGASELGLTTRLGF